MSNQYDRIDIRKKTLGADNPYYEVTVNQKTFQCRFIMIVPSVRGAEFPVTRHGRTVRIKFKLVSAGGAVVIENYSTTDTIEKKRDTLTGGLITIKQDTDYYGFEAFAKILRREGLGYKKLGSISAEDLKKLAIKAIKNGSYRPLNKDASIVRIDVCGSFLLDRRAEKTDEDFWTLYVPSAMKPIHEAVIRKIREKGWKYRQNEIDRIIEVLSSFAG